MGIIENVQQGYAFLVVKINDYMKEKLAIDF